MTSLPVDFYVDGNNIKSVPNLNLTISYGEHGDDIASYDWPASNPPRLRSRVLLVDPEFGTFWLGYIAVVQPSLRSCFKITCRGRWYTAKDRRYYENKKWLAGKIAKNIVLEAMTRCQYIFDAGIVEDLDFQIAEDTPGFGLQTPEDVFNYMQQVSGYLATPIVWLVRQNPNTPFSENAVLDVHAADFAPRYRVMLGPKDEYSPVYDADVVYNRGIVRWGNEQYIAATNNGYSDTQLPNTPDIVITPPAVDYSVIPDIRDKTMDVSASVNELTELQQLAGFLVTRNNVLRPVSSTIVIDCDTVIDSVKPAYASPNLQHWLVRSHFAIEVLNRLPDWGVYTISTHYINGAKYEFTPGKLTLSIGDSILQDTFRLLGSYDNSREYISVRSNVLNLTRRDADILVEYGTKFPEHSLVPNVDDSTILNNFSAGIPQAISSVDSTTRAAKFADPDKQFYAPTGQSLNPNIIADYGVQGNFGREADSIGTKGFIQVIPCKLLNWNIYFTPPAGSDTTPSDSISIEFYNKYPFIVGTDTPFATKSVSAATGASGDFTGLQQQAFPNGGKVGIRVSVAAATTGAGFQVAVGGRKLYPDLGIKI